MFQISEDYGKTWITIAICSWLDFDYPKMKSAYEKAGYATRYVSWGESDKSKG